MPMDKVKIPVLPVLVAFTVPILFFLGCAGAPKLPADKIICDQMKETWLPDGRRPGWLDKIPEDKSGFKYFVGLSTQFSTEQEARDRCCQNAIHQVANFCGVNVKTFHQSVSFGKASSSQIMDPDIAERTESSTDYDHYVSRTKAVEFAINKIACLVKQREVKIAYIGHVLVKVPEDEPKIVRDWQEKRGREQEAQKKREAELCSVFEKVRIANTNYLAKGYIITALDALAKADDLFQKIAKDQHYHSLYPQLQHKYGFPCDELSLIKKKVLEAICLEKVSGDTQMLVLGKDELSPLTLRAFVLYQGQPIALKNVPVVFQDEKGKTLSSLQTDLEGKATYQPAFAQPGAYRLRALLSLPGQGPNEAVQRAASFTLKLVPAEAATPVEEKLSVAVTFLYEKDGKTDKMYDGVHLRSEKDYYQVYFRPEQDCYIYIFQVDSYGMITCLFPNDAFSPWGNPVTAEKSYYLPYVNGRPDWLYLDRNTGEERIYFLASKKPDNEINRLYGSLSFDAYSTQQWKRKISSQIVQTIATRGVGGVAAGPMVQHAARDDQAFALVSDLLKSSGQEFFYHISINHIE